MKTKIIVGLAVLGVAGYLYYQSKKPKKATFAGNSKQKIFTNASGQIFSRETGKQIFK